MSTYRPKADPSEVFGTKPGKLKTPDVLSALRNATPGYNDITQLLSSNILSGLRGELDPDVMRTVLDASNSRAVQGGIGGSGFSRNLGLRDLGLTSQQVQNQAMQQAFNFLPIQSQTATVNPDLMAQINQWNLLNEAAPDPTARGNFLLDYSEKVRNDAKKAAAPQMGGTIPVGGAPNFGPSWATPLPAQSPAPSVFGFGSSSPASSSGGWGTGPGINFGGSSNLSGAEAISGARSGGNSNSFNPPGVNFSSAFNFGFGNETSQNYVGGILADAGIDTSIFNT